MNLINNLLKISSDDDISTRKLNMKNELRDSIERERNALGNNRFADFNGVTYWTTHVRKSKEKIFGNIDGANYNYNSNAFKYLMN